jgi:hypothetical protein
LGHAWSAKIKQQAKNGANIMSTHPIDGEIVSETAIVPMHQDAALVVSRAPSIVLEEARQAARALADVIESKPKKVVLNGKTYLTYEDWQTVARFYGVTAKVISTQYIEYGEVKGFEAHAVALALATGMEISAADAMCLNDEPKWNVRKTYAWVNGKKTVTGEEKVPFFQLRSMAQTRACAKALRNVLAFVPVLAGYEPTPAEEMDGAEPHATGTVEAAQAVAAEKIAAHADTHKSVLCRELGDGTVSLYGDGLSIILLALGDPGKEKMEMSWQGSPHGWVMPMRSSFQLEDVCKDNGVGMSYVATPEKPNSAAPPPPASAPSTNAALPLGHGKITNTEMADGKKGPFMRVWQSGQKMQVFDNSQMKLADGSTIALFTLLKTAKGQEAIFRVNKKDTYLNIVGVAKLGRLTWDEAGNPL